MKSNILIPVNSNGEQIVKCSDCGCEYPVCLHGCIECGSSKFDFIFAEAKEKNENT